MIDYLVFNKATLDIIAQILQFAVSVIGIISIMFVISQLRVSIRNTKVNILKTEFDIFSKISEKEKAFVDDYEKLIAPDEVINKELFYLYVKNKEQYLNELDLVCLYILNGYFTEKHFFQQYGEKILAIHKAMDNDEKKKYVNIDTICKKYKN